MIDTTIRTDVDVQQGEGWFKVQSRMDADCGGKSHVDVARCWGISVRGSGVSWIKTLNNRVKYLQKCSMKTIKNASAARARMFQVRIFV